MAEDQRDPKQKIKSSKALPQVQSLPKPDQEVIIPEELKPILKKLPAEEQISVLVALSVNRL